MHKIILELINPQPYCKVLEVTSEPELFTDLIAGYCKTFSGSLYVAAYSDTAVTEQPHMKVQHIKGFESPFRAVPRDYQNVFFINILSRHAHAQRLLQLAYRALVNAGEIIMIETKGNCEQATVEAMLEEYEFRAANRIEMLEGYDVFVAKKMHMWGNGL